MPFRARLRIAALAALPVIALVGCAPGALDVEEETVGATTTPSASPSASPEPSPSEEPVADGIDTSSWLTYTAADGNMSYRYPADWTLASEATPAGSADIHPMWDEATLTAPNGQALLHSQDFADIGGTCPPDAVLPKEILSVEPSQAMPIDETSDSVIATLVAEYPDRLVFGVGITTSAFLTQESCFVYFVGGSSAGGVSIGTHFAMDIPDPLWEIDSSDDAHAYMETEEYATLLEILRSVRTA